VERDPQTPAEAIPRVAERHLRAFFDLASEAMGLARDGRYVYVNPAFARLFAYESPDEMVGLPTLGNFAEAERPRILDYARRRAAGEPLAPTYHSRGLRRDGTEFEAELRAFGFKEGEAVYTASVVRDVTEARRLERELRESEKRFRELFEFVPVSLWEVDLSGVREKLAGLQAGGAGLRTLLESHPETVTELMHGFKVASVNREGYTQVGAKSPEELFASLRTLFDPSTFPRYRELGIQLAEGRTIAYAEGWSATVVGERRWLATTATVVPGHQEDWRRVLVASVDLTDRRHAEEERAALHERLRESEKLEAVGRLAGGIAHDFNNILAAVLSYSELTLLGLEQGSELRDHQERIREAALRARALIRQILTFSRRDVSNQRVVDVPAVVEEALSLMRAGIPSTVTLETRIDPDAGATLADPTQLHQIVLNLCSNARDAVGTYGRLEVEVAAVEVRDEPDDVPPGEYVRLRVRDDGVGMDAETKARIFEPYMTTKGPFGGHGLGLPVVHGIVSAARGAVHVESATGHGSTFDVYLPRREQPQPELPLRPKIPPGHGERVLVVDDEPLVRRALARVLRSLDYVVEEAEDGQQALARFQSSPESFDLVLTDQTMPHLAGTDLARALLAIRPTLPVILCTGYSDRIDDAGAREMGLTALLTKPADRETLAKVLREALGNR
jgi:PAS domain S-box-containing protein